MAFRLLQISQSEFCHRKDIGLEAATNELASYSDACEVGPGWDVSSQVGVGRFMSLLGGGCFGLGGALHATSVKMSNQQFGSLT